MAAEDTAETSSEPASEPERLGNARWQTLIHRGSHVVCVVSVVLAVIAADRYQRTQASVDVPRSGAFPLLLLAVVTCLLALVVVLVRPERGAFRPLVATTVTWTMVLALALAVVWSQIDRAVRDVESAPGLQVPMLTQTDVDAFLSAHMTSSDGGSSAPYRIPTGVLLESIEFLTPNNVRVNGYVWQKWPPGIPADVTRGFELPEAIDMADPGDPAYDITEADGTELIGWRIQTTLRQDFDYHRYPFDRQDVWLRLWARDFGRRVVLVPDFASYPTLDPAALPGLDQQFVYGGWTPEQAHFSYGTTRYDATLGYAAARTASVYPELYFNARLKRDFLEPFLDYVTFALAVALLLFGVLVLTTKDEMRTSRFGLSTFGVLGTAGSLFFAVILRESQLRNTIGPDQIVYLETLPVLLNLAILLVALNAILLAAPIKRRFALLEYRNNLLPTLLYWPMLLGGLLAVTLVVFYQ